MTDSLKAARDADPNWPKPSPKAPQKPQNTLVQWSALREHTTDASLLTVVCQEILPVGDGPGQRYLFEMDRQDFLNLVRKIDQTPEVRIANTLERISSHFGVPSD